MLNRAKPQEGLEFLDVDMDKDFILFMDPLLLSDSYTKIVSDFINHSFYLYNSGNIAEALKLFDHSHECNAVHLGYSKNKSKGSGVSKEMLLEFFSYVEGFLSGVRDKLLSPISFPLFIKSFSKDRMSDLIISLLKKDLLEFSLRQAEIHGIGISSETEKFDYWDIKNHKWEVYESKFLIDNKGDMLILIPKNMLNFRYQIRPDKYITSIIFASLKNQTEYKHANGKPFTNKELRRQKITDVYTKNKEKEYIKDVTKMSFSLFEEYYNHSLKFKDNKFLSDEELIKRTT